MTRQDGNGYDWVEMPVLSASTPIVQNTTGVTLARRTVACARGLAPPHFRALLGTFPMFLRLAQGRCFETIIPLCFEPVIATKLTAKSIHLLGRAAAGVWVENNLGFLGRQ